MADDPTALRNRGFSLHGSHEVNNRRTKPAPAGAERKQQSKQVLTMTNLVKRFANDETGATAIEYGLIAAGISVAIVTVVMTLGSQLQTTFSNISSQLATAGK
jgi:pilus assembly protein Flp/PilA